MIMDIIQNVLRWAQSNHGSCQKKHQATCKLATHSRPKAAKHDATKLHCEQLKEAESGRVGEAIPYFAPFPTASLYCLICQSHFEANWLGSYSLCCTFTLCCLFIRPDLEFVVKLHGDIGQFYLGLSKIEVVRRCFVRIFCIYGPGKDGDKPLWTSRQVAKTDRRQVSRSK